MILSSIAIAFSSAVFVAPRAPVIVPRPVIVPSRPVAPPPARPASPSRSTPEVMPHPVFIPPFIPSRNGKPSCDPKYRTDCDK